MYQPNQLDQVIMTARLNGNSEIKALAIKLKAAMELSNWIEDTSESVMLGWRTKCTKPQVITVDDCEF